MYGLYREEPLDRNGFSPHCPEQCKFSLSESMAYREISNPRLEKFAVCTTRECVFCYLF